MYKTYHEKYKSVPELIIMPRGRPKKYHTEQQRRIAKNSQERAYAARRPKPILGRYFRLVVPALAGYPPDWTWQTPSIVGLRARAVDLISARQRTRGLSGYLVAVERHAGSGLPHLDILLVYSKRVKNSPTRYDYVIKHGDLTRYRTINAAILEYGRKQDPRPLGNLDTARVVMQAGVRRDLYSMMQQAMMRDPFGFDANAWLHRHDLNRAAVKTNVYKAIRMCRDKQAAECNRRLTMRPGIREITPELIRERLTPEQLGRYESWSGYQCIVDHINQIPRWGFRRPHKTLNLYLCGAPNTGKSTLLRAISKHCATYPLGTRGGWFPHFQSGVYSMLVWDEFDLRSYRYTDLLKLLQGAPMKLPQKGGHVQRADNQLVAATSNLRLRQHISMRFRTPENRAHSRANLGVRFTQVVVPEGHDLFVLVKLILPADFKADLDR